MTTFSGPEVLIENLSSEQLYNKLSDLNNLKEIMPSSIQDFKTDKKPVLNLEGQHLRPCNFFNYQLIPKEPLMKFDDCNFNKIE